MRENWPTHVSATGGKFVLDDQADTYDLYDGVWEFPRLAHDLPRQVLQQFPLHPEPAALARRGLLRQAGQR